MVPEGQHPDTARIEPSPKGRFRWPPANTSSPPSPGTPQSDEDAAAFAAPGATIAPTHEPAQEPHWWSQIERVWLGRTATTWTQRCNENHWHPDAPGEYCPRCGRTAGPFELLERTDAEDPLEEPGCPQCHRKRVPWTRVTRLSEYDGLVRDAVHEVKFTAWRRLGRDLGRALGASIKQAAHARGVALEAAILVPVPTSFRRRLARGIDHTIVLAKGVCEELNVPLVRALARQHRPSQLTVRASDRWKNVRGTMKLRVPIPIETTVLILDDVLTTGATMAEACRAIRDGHRLRSLHPPNVLWPVVLGIAQDPSRRGQAQKPEPGQAGSDGARTA
jgi:predicted amidophosphoribosyltransferase